LTDVTLAAVGLIVLSPVMAAVALAVRRSLGRPVLFRQERPGMHGRQFTLVKFRTDEARAMGLHARERCTTLFDIRAIAPRYRAIFEEVAGR
jgi:lipopolysaccharide/colanic/teichoic acid biosynthesis glycosyltransferase